VIWRAGDFFSPAAEFIEDHHNIPQSVKAAVIDAVASSFPEFAVAIIAVLMIGQAEVGIATVIGSALYNILIIPAAVGLVATTPVLVSKEVVWRDNLFYVMVVFLLLTLMLLFPVEWGVGVSLVLLFTYVGYVFLLHQHYKKHKAETQAAKAEGEEEKEEEEKKELGAEEEEIEVEISSEKEAWLWILGMMLVMGAASYVLVEASIVLGDLIGVHQVIVHCDRRGNLCPRPGPFRPQCQTRKLRRRHFECIWE